jgi:uncharacterized protein YrrD
MKLSLILLGLATLSFPCLGDESPIMHSEIQNPPSENQNSNAETKGLSSDQNRTRAKWSTFIGREVQTPQNDKLGTVVDLALDMKNGKILAVIVSYDDSQGPGVKMRAVPPGAFLNFQEGHESGTLTLNTTKERFEAAPEFKWQEWNDYFESRRIAAVFHYYGVMPYFGQGALSLGVVKATRDIIGLPVRQDQSTLGTVVAIRVDSRTERLMLVLNCDTAAFSSKSEVMASEVQLNSRQDALIFDVSKQAGTGFASPTERL